MGPPAHFQRIIDGLLTAEGAEYASDRRVRDAAAGFGASDAVGMMRVSKVHAVAAGLSLAGCAGTAIVDFDVDARVSLERGGFKPGEVVEVPRREGALGPFPARRYVSEAFDWTFGTGTLGLGGTIVNKGGETLCLGFDKATIASNFNPGGVPLKTNVFRHTRAGKLVMIGTSDSRKAVPLDPPEVCIAPEERTFISFAPDLGTVFPSRKMFDVQFRDGGPDLANGGVGNWVAMRLPVRTPSASDVLSVTLQARDSRGRVSHY